MNDTLISRTYREYSLDGSPLKSIDENKMLTAFEYGKIHRIWKITLPGDFSTEPDEEDIEVIHNYVTEEMMIFSNKWGNINLKNNDNRSLFHTDSGAVPQVTNETCKLYSHYKYENHAVEINRAAFIGFSKEYFKSINSIDRAELILYHRGYLQKINGINAPVKTLNLKGIKSINLLQGTVSGGCQGLLPYSLTDITDNVDRTVIENLYNDGYYESTFDIANLIDTDLQGIIIRPAFNLPANGYNLEGAIQLYKQYGVGSVYDWRDNYMPRIFLEATFDFAIIIKKPLFKSGTITYTYDDNKNLVNVYSIRNLNSNDKGRIRHYLDSYGNIRKKDVFTTGIGNNDSSTSFYSRFNFLNLPAINTDAAGNITKLSYDGLQRLIKTENTDSSFTITSYTYQGSLAGYFTNGYTGYIEKQAFTDENGNNFWKYFDALGNLRREVKFIILDIPQGPEEEILLDPLITDYLYDDLYRLVMVKTPAGKPIEYEYDGYGRQVQRETPDTGVVKFRYDDNNNLVFSQDENQRAGRNPNQIFTFRRYDALNRLTVLGENSLDVRDFLEIDPNTDDDFTDGDNPTDPYYDYLVVNVYDSLGTSPAAIFDPPSDYQPAQQNSYYYTKGRLAATAYRTRKTDTWSFKYYKYDERGRIIRMWHVIHGLGTKKIDYYYNSQDQITNLGVLIGEADLKSFRYLYDIPGRLSHLDLDLGTPTLQNPVQYFNLVKYLYNQNSLISSLGLNEDLLISTYAYTNRNWILNCYDNVGIFGYIMDYFPNGNVSWLSLYGSYQDGFSDKNNIEFLFSYDKSNRLLDAVSTLQGDNYKLMNTYDKDGNILTLKRYAYDGTPVDDFSYTYYSGTNKLKNVSIQFNDFQYDANGNLILDDMNKNTEINYDHRNLIRDIRHWSYWSEGQIITTRIYYFYDEAGNRIRKLIFKTYYIDPVDPMELNDLSGYPEYDEEAFSQARLRKTSCGQAADDYFNNPISIPGDTVWYIVANEFYVRGVEGNELVLFSVTSGGSTPEKFNFFGSGNEGYIDAQNNRFYYMKDHLGSIRAVLNGDNEVISAQDYDMWGYLMTERSYDSNIAKYKFTGKERDRESNYDYFGARYYDARIGRWGGVDRLLNNKPSLTPYNYASNNPIANIDPLGLDDYYYKDGEEIDRQPGEYAWMYRYFEGIGIPAEFMNNYYVQHPEGNIIHNGSNYFKALSDVSKYNWNAVISEWENSWLGKRVNEVLNFYYANKDNYLSVIDFVYKESHPGGILDQKLNLMKDVSKNLNSSRYLYIYKGLALNWQEAGNVVWGRSMKNLGFTAKALMLGAQFYSLGTFGTFDQPNEMHAIMMGYYNSTWNFYGD